MKDIVSCRTRKITSDEVDGQPLTRLFFLWLVVGGVNRNSKISFYSLRPLIEEIQRQITF